MADFHKSYKKSTPYKKRMKKIYNKPKATTGRPNPNPYVKLRNV